jgi:hypothetical protein
MKVKDDVTILELTEHLGNDTEIISKDIATIKMEFGSIKIYCKAGDW